MPDNRKDTPLTAADCYEKAEECRTLAESGVSSAQRVMLLHVAETWKRIADAELQHKQMPHGHDGHDGHDHSGGSARASG